MFVLIIRTQLRGLNKIILKLQIIHVIVPINVYVIAGAVLVIHGPPPHTVLGIPGGRGPPMA